MRNPLSTTRGSGGSGTSPSATSSRHGGKRASRVGQPLQGLRRARCRRRAPGPRGRRRPAPRGGRATRTSWVRRPRGRCRSWPRRRRPPGRRRRQRMSARTTSNSNGLEAGQVGEQLVGPLEVGVRLRDGGPGGRPAALRSTGRWCPPTAPGGEPSADRSVPRRPPTDPRAERSERLHLHRSRRGRGGGSRRPRASRRRIRAWRLVSSAKTERRWRCPPRAPRGRRPRSRRASSAARRPRSAQP